MTDYQQQATNAYRELLKQAVWSNTEDSWEAAAKVLYEAFTEADASDQNWVYETLPPEKRKTWRMAAFAFCDFLAESLGKKAVRPSQEEASESVVPNANTRRCIEAYKRRIYDAISGPKESANFWDKAAAKLRYDHRKAFGESTPLGYGAIPEGERDSWRDAACDFATWIAEQLGETVVDAKPEDFQDDERKVLDIKLGLAPQESEPPKRPKVVTPYALLEAFVDAGIFKKDDFVQRVVIDITWKDVPKMYVEYAADQRMLNVVQTLAGIEISKATPSDEDLEQWVEAHPQQFENWVKRYDRIHGTSGMRRVR